MSGEGDGKDEAEFVGAYSGTPMDLETLVERAAAVDGQLGVLARDVLTALDAFNGRLAQLGYEPG